MSDLISRKAVLQILRINYEDCEKAYEKTKGRAWEHMMLAYSRAINEVMIIPTAYDTDKVAVELEKEYTSTICPSSKPCENPHTIGCCYDKAIKKAVEIVKGGVVKDE